MKKQLKKGILTRIKSSVFEGENYIGAFSHLVDCEIGYRSYCGSKCNLFHTSIGKYCSIASGVNVIFGEHPTKNWVSTHPIFYSTMPPYGDGWIEKRRFEEYRFANDEDKRYVVIGNDVWIASNVLINAGVKIGDGAVIAAGAVVTKDVLPYSIVGGVPAKEIGKRFCDEDVAFLLENPWWDKSPEWLKQHCEAFESIECYKNIVERGE